MGEPVVTWIRRDRSGQIVDQIALYREGENPAIYSGRLSDDGRFIMLIESAPEPEEPEPKADLTTKEIATIVNSPAMNLERAIEAYRTHGKAALPLFWKELNSGQQGSLGRLHEKLIRPWTGTYTPAIGRFCELVIRCADGTDLSTRPGRRSKRAPS